LAGANPITATEKAQELIARAINRSGMTPQQLAAQQAMTVGRLGPRDETLADIGGESVRRLARGAMAIPSGSQDDVTQMLLQRAQGAGQRIGQDITDLTAIGPRSILDVADEIIANRSALASPKYQQAYDVGVVESDAINNLLKIVIPGRIDTRRRYYSWIEKIPMTKPMYTNPTKRLINKI
jgi:hypothetical protein